MSVRILLVATLCVLFCSGVARADLNLFMADVNAGYTGDISHFQQRLAGRFAVNDKQLQMVTMAVDSPADAVVCLWIAEQSRSPLSLVLQRYQQLRTKGWGAVLSGLGISRDSGLTRTLLRGDLDWNRQVAGLR